MDGKKGKLYPKNIKQFMRCKKELNWTNEQLAESFGLPTDMVEQIFREMGDNEDSGAWKFLTEVFGLDYEEPVEDFFENIPVVRETAAYHIEETADGRKTLEDYYALPEDVRAELIDGQLYYVSVPSANHQLILEEIIFTIGVFLRRSTLKCKGFPAPFDVRLDQDDYTMVQPDYLIICDKSKYEGGIRCEGAPDLAIEIVSKSSKRRDYVLKLRKYKNAGVREYWIVDPLKMRIVVYTFGKDAIPVLYSFDDVAESKIYPGLKVDFAKIKSEMI